MIQAETIGYSADEKQAAWLVDDSHYLIMQECDDGWDYTLYTLDYREVDGGQLDMPELSIEEACIAVLEDLQYVQIRRIPVGCEDVLDRVDAAGSCSNRTHLQELTPYDAFCRIITDAAIS